jgi:hypothetical protein
VGTIILWLLRRLSAVFPFFPHLVAMVVTTSQTAEYELSSHEGSDFLTAAPNILYVAHGGQECMAAAGGNVAEPVRP